MARKKSHPVDRGMYLAKHQAKSQPAGRRMKGEELYEWRMHWLRFHLDREGIPLTSRYEKIVRDAMEKHASNLHRRGLHDNYVRAYGSSKPRGPSKRKLKHESRAEYIGRLRSMGVGEDEIYKLAYGRN